MKIQAHVRGHLVRRKSQQDQDRAAGGQEGLEAAVATDGSLGGAVALEAFNGEND